MIEELIYEKIADAIAIEVNRISSTPGTEFKEGYRTGLREASRITERVLEIED